MNLDAALEEAASLTPPVLSAWLATEAQRDAAQWQPQRELVSTRGRGLSPAAAADGGEEGGEEQGLGDGAAAAGAEFRGVEFREVAPLLFPLGGCRKALTPAR